MCQLEPMKWWIDRRVTAVLSLILLLLLSIGAVSYHSFISFQETAQWVQRSQSGIARLENLLIQLHKAETAQRRYFLTRDDRDLQPDLQPYVTAIESIHHHLERLETLMQDNPKLQQHLSQLESLVESLVIDQHAKFRQTIARRDDLSNDIALELIHSPLKQQEIEKIQSILQTMKAEANQAVAQRSQLAQLRVRRSWLLVSIESLIVMLLLAIVMFKINRDASRFQRIHQSLQAAETTFRRAVVDAPVPIMLHAEDGQVLQLSKVWTELTGYTQADIPTLSDWFERAYGQRKDAIQEKMARLDWVNKRTDTGGYPVRTRSGETRLWNFYSSPLSQLVDDRRIINTTAIDITEQIPLRKVLDSLEELEQRVAERTAHLEQANAALESFSHTVAHDLYAPLRTIQSFAEILLEDVDHLNAEERNSLERIYSAAQRMEAFVHDLLIYSRLERADLPLQPVNLSLVIGQVVSDLEDMVQHHQAQIHIAEPLAIVQANPIVLMQAMANLLTNAIKFVPVDTPPQIEIWTETVADGTMIRLVVQDNGVGIAIEDQERIFSIFERVHPAEIFPGSGIGLAIVQKAVERMGGRVGVESRPGQGSRFWLELPTNAESVELTSGEQS